MENKNINQFYSKYINWGLALSIIIFLANLIATFMGGKYASRSIIISGSMVGYVIAIKLFEHKKKNKLKKYHLVLFHSYGILCMFLWFGYPLNIIMSIFLVIAFVWEFRREFQRTR